MKTDKLIKISTKGGGLVEEEGVQFLQACSSEAARMQIIATVNASFEYKRNIVLHRHHILYENLD